MKRRLMQFLWKHATKIAVLVAVAFTVFFAFTGWAYFVVTRKFDSARMWDLPSRVYADATTIAPGQAVPRELLEPKLNYLGYHVVDHEVFRPGQYRFEDGDLEIYLQEFEYPDVHFYGMPVRLEISRGVVRQIKRIDDGSTLRGIRLEPELITSVFNDVMEDRVPVPVDKVSKSLIDAIVAMEDRGFFEHEGISIRGIVRAAITDLRNRDLGAGGSTLTQQLVKNLYLHPERTFRRKATEAVMAVILEARYSKNEILEAYLNEIYLGQNGAVQIVGVEQASQTYFGKSANNLTLAEAATLGGLIRSPNVYSPLRHPERATERRNVTLDVMLSLGMIDEAAHTEAKAEEMAVNQYPRSIRSAPYFVDLVLKELRETYPETQLTTEGLRIFTTLDTMMQRSAEKALEEGIEKLHFNFAHLKKKETRPEGVVLTIQPGTGYVKALVGGRRYSRSQFNRAFQARRQPGSLFKPFVYTAAMDPDRGRDAFTAATILNDTPITVETGRDKWQPRNYDGQFHGSMPVRTALVKSYNIPAVRAAIDAGMNNVIQMASRIGVESRLEPYPSISLGSFEVTPLEIAFAYSVFANEGVKSEPVTIFSVVNRQGKILENRVVQMKRVAQPSVCYVMNDILEDVIDEGTGSRVRTLGVTRPFAGKTGTTNDYRDAWFVGYSPKILTLVWVGFDDNSSLGLSGGTAAAPIWADHMKRIEGLVPVAEFRRPGDVIDREIDPTTGLLSSPYCPEKKVEIFITGTEPEEVCPYHSSWYDLPMDDGRRIFDEDSLRNELDDRLREREGRIRGLLRRMRDQ